MRAISKTNSHKNVDKKFRKAYCEEAGLDELLYWTGYRITDKGITKEHPFHVEQPSDFNPFDPHHIGHRGQKRDWRTNLIYIPRVAHDAIHYGTRGQPIDGVLLCLWAKLLKREKTEVHDEFDRKQLNECFGQSLFGWLNKDFGKLNWIRDEIIERG